ncbi:MAG TPA: hypothetical protein VMB05_17300 [Solirubrobacteraceae bacterium]|nr:hypothetical protein [Solirubrobacteraceae bacterium]
MSAMRNTLNAVRYDWLGVRIGGPGASMQGLWPVLIVAMLVVFGCFFAVGRLTTSERTPRGSSALVKRAPIPGGLHGASPVAGQVPSAVAPPVPQRKPTPIGGTAVAGASTQTFTGEAQSAPSTTSVAPESSTTPESSAASEPAPTRASTSPSSKAGGGGGASSASEGSGGHATPSGGSFDSSE